MSLEIKNILVRLLGDIKQYFEPKVQEIGCSQTINSLSELHNRLTKLFPTYSKYVEKVIDFLSSRLYFLMSDVSSEPGRDEHGFLTGCKFGFYDHEDFSVWVSESFKKAYALLSSLLDVQYILFNRISAWKDFLNFTEKYFLLALADEMESFFKYQSASFFCLLLKQTLPTPPKWFPDNERIGFIINGWFFRKFRALCSRPGQIDEKLSFGYSVMNIKRGCLEISVNKQLASLETHRDNMIGAEYKWDLLEKEQLRFDKLDEMVFKTGRMLSPSGEKSKWRCPTSSASYMRSKMHGGNHQYIAMELGLDWKGYTEFFQREGFSKKEQWRGMQRPLPIDMCFNQVLEGFASCKDRQPQETYSNIDNPLRHLTDMALTSRYQNIMCRVHRVLEPFKMRTITAGDSVPYSVARCFQKKIHNRMRKLPTFALTGEQVSSKLMNKIYSFSERNNKKEIPKDLHKFYEYFYNSTPLHNSVDYSNATDGMHPDVCQSYTNGICSTNFLNEKEKIVFNRTMDNHKLVYPLLFRNDNRDAQKLKGIDNPPLWKWEWMVETGHVCDKLFEHLEPGFKSESIVFQNHGQLMGSPSSFPGLCAVNFAVLWATINEYFEKNWIKWIEELDLSVDQFLSHFHSKYDLEMSSCAKYYDENITNYYYQNIHDRIHMYRWRNELQFIVKPEIAADITTAIFNGDDGLFRCNEELYRIWSVYAPLAGFNLSVGKSYLSSEFIMINSTCYSKYNWLTEKCDAEQWHQIFTVNPGLIRGQGRVLGDSRGLDGGERLMPICDQLKWCMNCSAVSEGERVTDRFKEHNLDRLTKTCRSWRLPRALGGLGLPFGGEPTFCQKKLAAYLLMDNTASLPQGEKYCPDYTSVERVRETRIMGDLCLYGEHEPGTFIEAEIITSRNRKPVRVRYGAPDLSDEFLSPFGIPKYKDDSEEKYSKLLYKVLKKPWLNPIADDLVKDICDGNYTYIPCGHDRPVYYKGRTTEKFCICTIKGEKDPYCECQLEEANSELCSAEEESMEDILRGRCQPESEVGQWDTLLGNLFI